MSLKSIRAALDLRLATLTPVIATAQENGKYEPTIGTPYQKVSLLPNETEAPALNQQTLIERGIYQISVCYPFGNGSSNASARAELIRSHFPAGLTLTQDGYKVRISRAPSIARAIPDDMWYIVPVSIQFICIK